MDFNVENIIKHKRESNDTIRYLVKWQGYGNRHNTWEPSANFARGNAILRQYQLLNGIEPESSSNESETEEDTECSAPDNNLTSPDQVINLVRRIAKSWRLEPEVESYPEEGKVTLLLHRNHFFVTTTHKGENLIADGQNWGDSDKKVKREIEQRMGRHLTTVRYERQDKENYCGSAAAAIALAWLRAHTSNNWPTTIKPTFKATIRRVEQQLHKGTKTPLQPGRVPIAKQNKSKEARLCKHCGKTTHTTHSGHQAHLRMCTRN